MRWWEKWQRIQTAAALLACGLVVTALAGNAPAQQTSGEQQKDQQGQVESQNRDVDAGQERAKQQAGQERAKQQAGQARQEGQKQAGQARQEAQKQAGQQREQAQERAGDAREHAQQRAGEAREQAGQRRERATRSDQSERGRQETRERQRDTEGRYDRQRQDRTQYGDHEKRERSSRDQQQREKFGQDEQRERFGDREGREDQEREQFGDDRERFRDREGREDRTSRDRSRDREDRIQFSTQDNRLRVRGLSQGTWGTRIGLRDGDVIVSVDGDAVRSEHDFYDVLGRSGRDRDRVGIVVLRDGNRQTIYWSGGDAPWMDRGHSYGYRPHEEGYEERRVEVQDGGPYGSSDEAFLGVILDRRYPNLAVVQYVIPDSSADQAGLQKNDTIWEVNGQRIGKPDDLVQAIEQSQPGESIELRFSRPESHRAEVRLGDRSERQTPSEQYSE